MADTDLILTGTSEVEDFELTASADDGIVTVNVFGEEDSITINGLTYDYDQVYAYAVTERQLDADTEVELVTDDEGNEQILLSTASSVEDESSSNELFAVLNLSDDFTLTGTSEADTFELTDTATDGVITIDDFSTEDSISVAGDTYDADMLYAFAVSERQISADIDTTLITDEDGNQQIVLLTDDDGGDIVSYDDVFAVVNLTTDMEWVA